MTAVLERPASIEQPIAAPVAGVTAAAVEELVRSHLPLAHHLVREVSNRVPAHVLRDDLVSAAMFALATSARSFDASMGTSFAAYASMRIRGALTDELRSMDWATRSVRSKARQVDATRRDLEHQLGRTPTTPQLAAALGVTVAELATIESDTARADVVSLHALPNDADDLLPGVEDGPESFALRRETLVELRAAIDGLPSRLSFVVEQYFFAQRKMHDIAAELGVTESRVSQLRTEALVRLRALMHSDTRAH
jgi:RNA polymerase sigma factor for flagellar operon FliA